ncbi:FtsK/SpoIIIE domain-containing protein [Boudabousia marimammalium]|uniref:FtsK domain-containing protein n=1 Tax=Boudabousia marimammalium TaxID=156892 RepID=A0A1Q5PLW1_9ACTO|nr:FtsK/SpoIIIE domain-containing protein [Boudabousia marimammalium]OKL48044.1 hypothetical protein BM477_06125 [Boudabousia marimammalium]
MFSISDICAEAHLAVLSGPDAGVCLPPGPFGLSHGLSDPDLALAHGVWTWDADRNTGTLLLSHQAGVTRQLFQARPQLGPLLSLFRFSRRLYPGRSYQIRVGTRFASGNTIWQVRLRPGSGAIPAPQIEAERTTKIGKSWRLFALLPLLFSFTLLLRLTGWGGVETLRWLPALGGIMVLLLSYWVWRGKQKLPVLDPAQLLAAATLRCRGGAPPKSGEAAVSAWLSDGWVRRRPQLKDSGLPQVLTVTAGETICLTGPSALPAMRWWAAQLLLRRQSRHITDSSGTWELNRPSTFPENGGSAPTLRQIRLLSAKEAETAPPCQADEVLLVCAERTSQAPWDCNLISTAPPAVGSANWWRQLMKPTASSGLQQSNLALERNGWMTKPRSIAQNWQKNHPGLSTEVGAQCGDSAPSYWLDLAASGPHALVAGTSGSGKSEALLTWLGTLCTRHSPTQLSLILIDYKGGATFNRLAGLPHTMGVLTDLDTELTVRALAGISLELKRREQVFASRGLSDYDSWLAAKTDSDEILPRLLIAVDEFRELAQHAPAQMESLIRLASQGRSLGMHLILATQRPAGAVDSTIRANCPLRVALRVTDSADSYDVLGDGSAATLETKPGNAIVQAEQSTAIRFDYLPKTDLDQLVKACQIAAKSVGRTGCRVQTPWTEPLPETLTQDHPALLSYQQSTPVSLPLGLYDAGPSEPAQVFGIDPGTIVTAGGGNTWQQELTESLLASAHRANWETIRVGPDLNGPHDFDWHDPNWLQTVHAEQCLDSTASGRLMILEAADQWLKYANFTPGQIAAEATFRSIRQSQTSLLIIGDSAVFTAASQNQADLLLAPAALDPISASRLGLSPTTSTRTRPRPFSGLIIREGQAQTFTLTRPKPLAREESSPARF